MPRLTGGGTHQVGTSNFSFNGARIEDLGASEYTLVGVVGDETGSTAAFKDELRKMLVTAIEACKRSPRSDNLLARVTSFSTAYSSGGVNEWHGFTPLSDIDPQQYREFTPRGATPLYDATYDAVHAMAEYGGELTKNDFLVNGILFVITDGVEGDWTGNPVSSTTPAMIARIVREVRQQEKLESLIIVLIGINAGQYASHMQAFRHEAELDQYIDAGEATSGKLAKLAAFVSQSVSSQSQALGTGGPSQAIAATI